MVDPAGLPPVVGEAEHRLPDRPRQHQRPVEQRPDEGRLPVLASGPQRRVPERQVALAIAGKQVAQRVALPRQQLEADVLDGPPFGEGAVGVGCLRRQRRHVARRDVELRKAEAQRPGWRLRRELRSAGSPEGVACPRMRCELREPDPRRMVAGLRCAESDPEGSSVTRHAPRLLLACGWPPPFSGGGGSGGTVGGTFFSPASRAACSACWRSRSAVCSGVSLA